jgi:hypothetical protein
MGREAVAVARWNGEIGQVKALLESAEILLRGEIRAAIPRSAISTFSVDGDTLIVAAAEQVLRLELGHAEANKWAAVLSKPIPTLAQKLGISEAHRAFVFGPVDDVELAAALHGAVANTCQDAAVVVAVLVTEADLTRAITLGREAAPRPVWCVYGKGKFATITDSVIRATMRASGFVDNKTSGVSDRLTATRYQYRPAGC